MTVSATDYNITTDHYSSLVQILGADLISSDIESSFDYITLADKGVNARAIKNFSKHFDVSRDQMAKFLNVSEPTIYRWISSSKVMSRNYAVQLFELTDLFLFGIAVLEDRDHFFKWLQLPNAALGGIKPQDLLDLPGGIDKVRDVLGRIEFGVYS